jgi:hypothetical protein
MAMTLTETDSLPQRHRPNTWPSERLTMVLWCVPANPSSVSRSLLGPFSSDSRPWWDRYRQFRPRSSVAGWL